MVLDLSLSVFVTHLFNKERHLLVVILGVRPIKIRLIFRNEDTSDDLPKEDCAYTRPIYQVSVTGHWSSGLSMELYHSAFNLGAEKQMSPK